ncbi:hypothetical protein [Plasticicumulans acidivorans]|uniref:Uncharacterized protein n=1 Tax=Plasticicumulans acidivorans TaxID=886464 RepID=A0A317MU94_9GAMM|nr:hypothetical protein [Plasticicumulans acidivorans]PWV61205.1 hypothetical protein C7443_106219 [Plasticicumulans acidivorans]
MPSARPDLVPAAAPPLHWRAYGRAADLDLCLDADARTRNAAVSALLAALLDGAAADRLAIVSGLTLAGRIGALLAIVGRSEGCEQLTLALRCRQAGCDTIFEVELALAALLELAQAAESEPLLTIADVRLRRPTGDDQRRWQAAAPPPGQAAAVLLGTLIVDPAQRDRAVDAHWRARAGEQLEVLDPLPCFTLSCRCPDCAGEADYPLDLEAQALARLGALRRRLLREVHRLASRYGWDEARILDLPPARRCEYLALIDAEEPRP